MALFKSSDLPYDIDAIHMSILQTIFCIVHFTSKFKLLDIKHVILNTCVFPQITHHSAWQIVMLIKINAAFKIVVIGLL